MLTDWYIQVTDKECGPYSLEEMQTRAKSGQLAPQTPVRQDGTPWVPASCVDFLSIKPQDSLLNQPNEVAGLASHVPQERRSTGIYHLFRRPIVVWSFAGVLLVLAVGTALTVHKFQGIANQHPSAIAQQPVTDGFDDIKDEHFEVLRDAVSPALDQQVTAAVLSAEELYARCSPAVITITTKNQAGKKIGSGSGFFVDSELLKDEKREMLRAIASNYSKRFTNSKDGPYQGGHVLTNYHVIQTAVDAEITLSDGTSGHVFNVVAEDEDADLALLSVIVHSNKTLTRLGLATNASGVGSNVCAIGSPRGLANSLSIGIISGTRELTPGVSWLQTTASISPGSSGGPLLTFDGSVIGLTTAIRTDGQNLNFAIPVQDVRQFLKKPECERYLADGRSIDEKIEATFRDISVKLAIRRQPRDRANAQFSGSDSEELLCAARDLIARQKLDEAIAKLTESTISIPRELAYLRHFLLGDGHLQIALREAREAKSSSTVEHYQMVHRNQHWNAAINSLRQSVNLQSNFAPTYAMLADCYDLAGQWKEAFEAANSLVGLMPRCAEGHYKRGRCNKWLERYRLAAVDLQSCTRLDPAHRDAHFELAGAWLNLAEYEKAVDSYKTSMSIDSRFEGTCYYGIGHALRLAGKYQQAIDALEKSRALGHAPHWCNDEIAKCRQAMGR